MSRDINPFGLRMPPDLRQLLEDACAESGRSMNAELVARLNASFAPQSIEGVAGDALVNLVSMLRVFCDALIASADENEKVDATLVKVAKVLTSPNLARLEESLEELVPTGDATNYDVVADVIRSASRSLDVSLAMSKVVPRNRSVVGRGRGNGDGPANPIAAPAGGKGRLRRKAVP